MGFTQAENFQYKLIYKTTQLVFIKIILFYCVEQKFDLCIQKRFSCCLRMCLTNLKSAQKLQILKRNPINYFYTEQQHVWSLQLYLISEKLFLWVFFFLFHCRVLVLLAVLYNFSFKARHQHIPLFSPFSPHIYIRCCICSARQLKSLPFKLVLCITLSQLTLVLKKTVLHLLRDQERENLHDLKSDTESLQNRYKSTCEF